MPRTNCTRGILFKKEDLFFFLRGGFPDINYTNIGEGKSFK
jgi:hypothetical protein